MEARQVSVKAAVFKFIPDQFPDSVGAVGGMVGLLGGLGGFVFPPVFGYLLGATGLWSSCWVVLMIISTVCLVWMHLVVRRIMNEEAPELVQLVERRPSISIGKPIIIGAGAAETTVDSLLKQVSFFGDFTKEELKALAQIGERRALEPDEIVFREGDPG